MSAYKRYSQEEDELILKNWWNQYSRDEIIQSLNRSKPSLNFRYYALLKKLGIDPREHKQNRGVIPESVLAQENEDVETSMADKLEELEGEIESLRSDISYIRTFISGAEPRVSSVGIETVSPTVVEKETVRTNESIEEVKELRTKLLEITNEYNLQVEKNKRLYSELDYWLGQFFRLNNIEKLSALADFLPKIRGVVDKYGNDQTMLKVDLSSLGFGKQLAEESTEQHEAVTVS
jgi:hypothetical protein